MGIRIYGGDNLALTDPAGVSVATAAEISTLSVSHGALLKTDVEDIAFRGTSGWWKFTPTQTGVVNFDLGLSYNMFTGKATAEQPDLEVSLYTGPVGATSLSDLSYSLDSSEEGTYEDGLIVGHTLLGSLAYLVTAGQQYYISVAEANSQSNTIIYLRVSDYGAVSDWHVPAQATIQMVPPYGIAMDATNHPMTYNPYVVYMSEYGPTYLGNYQLSRAFAGYPASSPSDPTPWPAGPECAWRYGRRGNFGGQWWSLYGGNGAPAGSGLISYSWNGTDPYNGSIPGHGTCRVYAGGIPTVDSYGGSYYHGYTGIQFIADEDTLGFFYYQDTYMRSFGTSQYTSVTHIIDQLTANNVGVVIPPGAGVFGTQLEETDVEIVDFQYAFDEYAGDTTHTGYTEWFVDVTTSGDDTPAGYWGPNRGATNDMAYWQGGADGPEGFDARSTNLGSYLGGLDNWRSLDMTMVNAAIAAERGWTDTDHQPFGLRWVGIHPSSKADTLPTEIAPFDYTHGSKTSDRVGQHVAIQVTVQPRSYRYTYRPDIPGVTEITGSITGAQDIGRAVFRYRGTG